MAKQLGVPLNDKTLASMADSERDFWQFFLKTAMDVVRGKIAGGEPLPFTPTAELRALYGVAVNSYNGATYCQVRQLQQMFSFEA